MGILQTSLGSRFILVELDRSLVFPCVEYTRYVIMKSGNVWAKNDLAVVVDCQYIQFADFTAAKVSATPAFNHNFEFVEFLIL